LQISLLDKSDRAVIRGSLLKELATCEFEGCVGVGEGLGLGVGAATLTVSPLLQTNFFPDLIHLNFNPPAILVDPCLAQLAPGLTGAADTAGRMEIGRISSRPNASFLTYQRIDW